MSPTPDNGIEDQVEGFVDAIEKALEGKSESGLAKVAIGLLVALTGTPWWALAEPFVARLLARLNNQRGKDAVALIAQEVAEDEGRRKAASEIASSLEGVLEKLFARLEEGQRARVESLRSSVEASADDLLARLGIQLHWFEERLRNFVAPQVGLLRVLHPGTLSSTPSRRPSALLVAAREVVPFAGREVLIEHLTQLLQEPNNASIAVICGRGGSGKTRLAIETTQRWRASGIPAGFLRSPLGDQDVETIASGAGIRVVVVDYAESKPALLRLVLQRLSKDSSTPVRLILLARSLGAWWNSLESIPETDSTLVTTARIFNLDQSTEAALSAEERRTIWETSHEIFRNTIAPTEHQSTQAAAPDVTSAEWNRPLVILMHALLSVWEGAPQTEPELLKRVLKREERFQGASLERLSQHEPELSALASVTSELLAIATLLGRVAPMKLAAIGSTRLQQKGLNSALLVDPLLRTLQELYPEPDATIGPLAPDIVGEELVARETGLQRTPSTIEVASELAKSEDERTSVVQVLARHARRTHDASRIERLLDEDFDLWSTSALAAIAEDEIASDSVATALINSIKALAQENIAVCERISNACPPESLALARVATAATRALLEAAQSRSQLSDCAKWSSVLGARLERTGHTSEAIRVTQAAISHYKAVVDQQPSLRAELASATRHLGNQLEQAGRWNEALACSEEALRLYQELETQAPRRYLADVANCLTALTSRFAAIGDASSSAATGRRAVAIWTELVERYPTNKLFQSILGRSLAHLSRHLPLGQGVREAEAATAFLRKQAAPQRSRDLVRALIMLAQHLEAQGDNDAGLEKFLEAKAELDAIPETSGREDRVALLFFQSGHLAGMGRNEEARALAEEAVNQCGYLELEHPQNQRMLADCLIRLSAHLIVLKQPAPALEHLERASGLYDALVERGMDPTMVQRAGVLQSIGVCLTLLGRHQEAVATSRSAVAMLEAVPPPRSQVLVGYLAEATSNLADHLHNCKDRAAALGERRKAVKLLMQSIENKFQLRALSNEVAELRGDLERNNIPPEACDVYVAATKMLSEANVGRG